MQEIPHAPGYTLAADGFMAPDELVGFAVEHHYRTVFDHYHEFHELALVMRGSGTHVTSEGAQRVGPGCIVFVPPGVSHGWELCDDMLVSNCLIRDEAMRFDLWWAQRDPLLSRLLAPGAIPRRVPIIVQLEAEAFATCHDQLEAIRLRRTEERSRSSDLGHLLLALDVVARAIAPGPGEDVAASMGAPAVVRSALTLLERDLRRPWSLHALADELSIGRYHLVRLFHRWVGMPPITYANRRRVELAAALLAGTEAPVAAIGTEVGWPDASGFARRFRRAYGVSPRAYRAQSRSLRRQGAPISGWRPDVDRPAG